MSARGDSLKISESWRAIQFPGGADKCECAAGRIAPLWSYSTAKHRIFCSYCGADFIGAKP